MNNYERFMNEFPQLNSQLARLQKVSSKGLVAKDLFRVICRTDMILLSYIQVYGNKGAITKGVEEDTTLDGISYDDIHKLVTSLKDGTYRPNPVKRVPIPKKSGGERNLGIPTSDDKLVQMAMKICLEHIYEQHFSDCSHGFRPQRSCHTALRQIKHRFTSVRWFVEFDIKGFFDNVNHEVLIALLETRMDDKRFIKLLRRFLKAGYMENWDWYPSYSGMPQGGIISPLLSNIYLHELDSFVATLIERFNKGNKRPQNPEYNELTKQMNKSRKQIDEEGNTPERLRAYKQLEKERLQIPRFIENNDIFKRLVYCRYADDFIFGVIGSYTDAKNLMLETESFLRDNLQLELSSEKTCVRQSDKGIEFLSYGIKTQYGDKIKKVKMGGRFGGRHTKQRTLTGSILLTVPKSKVMDFCQSHGYGDWQNRNALHRPKLLYSSEVEIIYCYNAEMRGFANYYGLARDMKHSLSLLSFMQLGSLYKTLANKRKTSMMQVKRDLKTHDGFAITVQARDKESGEYTDKQIKVWQLKHWKPTPVCNDRLPLTVHLYLAGSELYLRMNAFECEYCGKRDRPLEVHHIKKFLKDMKHLEHWQKVMIQRYRKTMILCSRTADSCHVLLHQGKLHDKRFNTEWQGFPRFEPEYSDKYLDFLDTH